MSKTIELRKDINSILKQLKCPVFYRRATDKVKFPYIVYTLKDVGDSKLIEIDYWDNDSDTTVIETLADDVFFLLDKETLTNENHSISFYHNQDKQWLDDEDKNLSRINESYILRYYGKE